MEIIGAVGLFAALAAVASQSPEIGWLGSMLEGARPWVSTGALVGLCGLAVKLWLDNRKLSLDDRRLDLDSEGGIRDHYAKELAALRLQFVEVQDLADKRLANAERRYTESIELADRRHASCEAVCQKLREQVYGLERQIAQLQRTSLKMFEPRLDLPDDQREKMRSMEQPPVTRAGGLRRGKRSDG